MKKAVLTFSLLLTFIGIGQLQALAGHPNSSLQDTARIYSLQEVDQLPEFVNPKPSKKAISGKMENEELYRFLQQSFRYPVEAARARAQGNMIATFVIDKAGNLSDIKMLNSVHPGLDEELMRVIRMSKVYWKPAIKNGNPVSVSYILPYRVSVM